MPDITAVLNAHREGRLAHASLRSLARAVEETRRRCIDAEILVVLDRPDEPTVEYFEWAATQSNLRLETIDQGDLGAARNHAAQVSTARYLGYLDGDDLWCSCWLWRSFELCNQHAARTICHPEMNLVFGSAIELNPQIGQDSPLFQTDYLRQMNYWTALSFAERSIYLDCPYNRNELKDGFGFEDWSWNCETICRGYQHRIVPMTSHFIRRKENGSLRVQTLQESCLVTPSSLFRWSQDNVRQRRAA